MRWIAAPAALVLALAAALHFDEPTPPADLVIVNRGDVFTLDPQRMTYLKDMRMAYALFEGLVRWNNDDFTIETAACESLPTVSEDGRTYTFGARAVCNCAGPWSADVARVFDLARKDAFNGLEPTGDGAALNFVTNPEVPRLMLALFGVQTPPTPRNDLVTIFLTGLPGLNQIGTNPRPSKMLRLNTGIPPATRPRRLGVLAGDVAGGDRAARGLGGPGHADSARAAADQDRLAAYRKKVFHSLTCQPQRRAGTRREGARMARSRGAALPAFRRTLAPRLP